MSSDKKRKEIIFLITKFLYKKRFLIIMFFILLIGLGYGIFVFVNSNNKKTEISKTPEQQVEQIIAGTIQNNDDKTAQDELIQLADSETDLVKKSVYLYASADLYYNSEDYINGIEVAKNIDELTKTSTSAGGVAYGYMMNSDYANAVKYYQIAIDRTEKPASEMDNSPYNEYSALKREAEAKI